MMPMLWVHKKALFRVQVLIVIKSSWREKYFITCLFKMNQYTDQRSQRRTERKRQWQRGIRKTFVCMVDASQWRGKTKFKFYTICWPCNQSWHVVKRGWTKGLVHSKSERCVSQLFCIAILVVVSSFLLKSECCIECHVIATCICMYKYSRSHRLPHTGGNRRLPL